MLHHKNLNKKVFQFMLYLNKSNSNDDTSFKFKIDFNFTNICIIVDDYKHLARPIFGKITEKKRKKYILYRDFFWRKMSHNNSSCCCGVVSHGNFTYTVLDDSKFLVLHQSNSKESTEFCPS